MKANELMIGDWVKIKTYGVSDKYERTEAYIYVKVAEIGSGLITVEYNNDIKEPYRICENTEIEPILLTPEILEKNGFVLKPDGWLWYKEKGIEDQNYIFIQFRKKCDEVRLCELNFVNKVLAKYERMHNVHELQHAMRLCGIEKEIEL